MAEPGRMNQGGLRDRRPVLLQAGNPKRTWASSVEIFSEVHTWREASCSTAVRIIASNWFAGRATPSCAISRMWRFRSRRSVRNDSQVTGSSVVKWDAGVLPCWSMS